MAHYTLYTAHISYYLVSFLVTMNGISLIWQTVKNSEDNRSKQIYWTTVPLSSTTPSTASSGNSVMTAQSKRSSTRWTLHGALLSGSNAVSRVLEGFAPRMRGVRCAFSALHQSRFGCDRDDNKQRTPGGLHEMRRACTSACSSGEGSGGVGPG